MDKKIREHRIEHEKFIIFLDDNVVFDNLDQVKIIRKRDFETLGVMISS